MPEGSFERGFAEFEDEAYLEAIDDLKLFIRRNPTDPRSDDAQFFIGRAHQERFDFPVAAVEFEILRKDYPNSDWFDEAYYQQGMCYVEQVPRYELEQSVTRDAIAHFQRYLRDVPDGAFQNEAQKQVDELQLILDEKRMEAVRHYLRVHQPGAARVYLDVFLDERPDSPFAAEALFMSAKVRRQLADFEGARQNLEELVQRFPEHKLASRAQRELADLRGDS